MNKTIFSSWLEQLFESNSSQTEEDYESTRKQLVKLNKKYSPVYYESKEQLQNFLDKNKYYSNPKTVLYRFDTDYLVPKLSDLSLAIKEFKIYQETFVLIYEKISKASYSIEPKKIIQTKKIIDKPLFINNEVLLYEELASKLESKTKYILNILDELDYFDDGMQFLQHKLRRLEELELKIFHPEISSSCEMLKQEHGEAYDLAIANRQALFRKEKPFVLYQISNLIDSRKFQDAGELLYEFIGKFSLYRFLVAEKRIKGQACTEQGEYFMLENLEGELENIITKKQQKNILEKYRLKNQYFVYCQTESLWQIIINNSEKFNYFSEKLDDFELETIPNLRYNYPELATINDASLYGLYDDYQDSCNLLNAWKVDREKAFLFYLICYLANFKVEDPGDIFFGEIMAYFLLQDKSLEVAKSLAMKIKKNYSSYKVYF